MTGKVIVAMSGGVDSSVAAFLLHKRGLQVEGLFMKNWEEDDDARYCSAAVDLADAQKVCQQLDIPLHTVNFSSEYWDHVFDHFLREYRAGRTPNPDIVCNKEIKFRAFLDHALGLGAKYIATGHYARCEADQTSIYLKKGLDANKDQSYFLHTLNKHQLANTLFPLGEMKKSEVRAIAGRENFSVHDKKDSTGICFIGERKFKDFLKNHLPAKQGDIVTPNGERIGRHDGVAFYTIGQRQGLNIGGKRDFPESAWYVADKDPAKNRLIVVQGNEHEALFHSTVTTSDLYWIDGRPPPNLENIKAKIRYRQPDQACMIRPTENAGYKITFTVPQRAVTPGQSVVLYRRDVCLGGGIIEERAA